MINLKILALAFLVCGLAVAPSAQPLWGPTTYGMSVSEVRSLIRPAVPPATPGGVPGAELGLVAQDLPLDNHNYDINFYFRDDKLKQVNLVLDDDSVDSDYANALVFEGLARILTYKYGASIFDRVRGSGISASSTWVNNETNITLTLLSDSDREAYFVGVVYQLRLRDQSEKL